MTEQQGDPRHLETLDRDLARFSNLEIATGMVARPMALLRCCSLDKKTTL
jgi:PiT family inorganic phosphate transporter